MILAIVLWRKGPRQPEIPWAHESHCSPENRVKKAQALSPGEGKGSIVSLEKGSWS